MATQGQGESFLHERNPRLHMDEAVQCAVAERQAAGERIPNQPEKRVAAYMGWLAANDVLFMSKPDDPELVDDFVARQYARLEHYTVQVTTESANRYADFKDQVAREMGLAGYVNARSQSEAQKLHELSIVHDDQLQQLHDWVEELNLQENGYPTWFKYWAFECVTRLNGQLNEDLAADGIEKGYEERSRSSFALFPDLNRESLARLYEAMQERLGGPMMGFDDNADKLRQLLPKANFGRLYAEAQNAGFRISDELRAITKGSWQRYPQTTDPRSAEALSRAIRRYRTGWCTAGAGTAAAQLERGDFLLWSSFNPNTKLDEVPRIAIRMENGMVAEVRGIVGGRTQELEPELIDTAMEMLQNLPGGASYFQIAKDMKRVTNLDKLTTAQPDVPLSAEDVAFLYETDRNIVGFGHVKDVRVAEIIARRGTIDDRALEQIFAETEERALDGEVAHSIRAYNEIASQLGVRALSERALQKAIQAQRADWRRNGVMRFVGRQHHQDGTRFSLVVMPNVAVSGEQLDMIFDEFSNTWGDDNRIAYNMGLGQLQLSEAQLTGRPTEGKVRFALVADRVARHSGDDLSGAKQFLSMMHWIFPSAAVHTPSLLEAITYWHVLRAQGRVRELDLNDQEVFELTATTHVDVSIDSISREWTSLLNTHVRRRGPWIQPHPDHAIFMRLVAG